MSTAQEAILASILPNVADRAADHREVFEANRHRVYSLAFWMTGSELAAEELMGAAFTRAFATGADVDRALIAELRESMAIGTLSLASSPSTSVRNVRRNVKRVHLEQAVVQLPATERLIFLFHDVEKYGHERIAYLLGISLDESQHGLHQARLRMRELIAALQD